MVMISDHQHTLFENQQGYAQINGIKMYYEIQGAGKPAVYIHPAWGRAGVLPALTKNRQWISVDLQGHGRTADTDRPWTFEQSADDVAALLKHLQIDQADLFGESFGGAVALAIALRHPELVGRVATYASPYGKFEEVYPHSFLGEFMSISDGDDSVKFQRDNYLKVAPDPTQWPTLFTKINRVEWKGFSHDELKSIQAPVLIAVGDHDFVRLEHCLEIFRLLPNAQLAVVPDAGHFVLNVDSEKLLPIIAAFLDEPMTEVPFATPKTGYHPGVTR